MALTSETPMHPWNVTPEQARAIQNTLCPKVVQKDRLAKISYVAGVDVGFKAQNTLTHAAVAVLRFPELELHEQATAVRKTAFPYVPGLLSFREIPAILDALNQLTQTPDLLLCDGQGLAHPRRFGLACHLGVLTNLPSIGVAKSRLIGKHDPLPKEKGNWVPLTDKAETIGAVLRSRTGINPLYISIGHRISLPTAIDYVMRCLTRYRLPETTRQAHRIASG